MSKVISALVAVMVICFGLQSVSVSASAGLFDVRKTGEMQDTSSSENQPLTWVLDYNTLSGAASLKISGNGYMPNGTSDSWLVDLAQSGCMLVDLTVENGVKSIMSGAFSGQYYLTEVTLPDSVEFIGEGAFSGTAIEKFCLPASLESFDGTVFSNSLISEYTISPKNLHFKAVDGVVYSKDGSVLVAYPSGRFYENSSLVPKIPKSVTTIGRYAFLNCGEKSITIPANVKTIEMQAFAGNTNLKTLNIENGLEYIYDGVFLACKALSGVRLPRSVKYIGYCALGCKYKIDFESLEMILDSHGIEYDKVTEENIEYYLSLEPIKEKYSIDSFVVCYADESFKIYAPKNSAGHNYALMTEVKYVQSEALEPKLVSASAVKGGVKLSWSLSSDASGYNVYRKTSDGKWKLIKEISGKEKTTFVDKSAVQKAYNSYTVRAVAKSGKSSYNKKGISAYYLKTPALEKVAVKSDGLKVYWNAVKGAESYNIYRKAADSTKWEHIAIVKGTKNTYGDRSVKHNVKYTYTVKAWDSEGVSGYDSTGISNAYVTPPKISSIGNTVSGVKIKWSAVSKTSKYRIYRRLPGGSWVKLADVKGSVTSFVDKKAVSGKTYEYAVRAYIGAEESAVVATGKIMFLGTPVLEAAKSTKSGIKISFTSVKGAKGYKVYRKTSADGKWERIATVKDKTAYLDKTAEKGKIYYYTVKAVNGSYSGGYDKNGLKIKDKY